MAILRMAVSQTIKKKKKSRKSAHVHISKKEKLMQH